MKKTLLVGNDINNIGGKNDWEALLIDIMKFCGVSQAEIDFETPFPLLYEEIFIKSLKNAHQSERQLKKYIADRVSVITPNEIHVRLREFHTSNIITTNYEFAIEGKVPMNNCGIQHETIYSIFRHYLEGEKKYWHIHGDCKRPSSINLGFQHYIGQLKHIRDYVIKNTISQANVSSKVHPVSRLEITSTSEKSWIDLFFTSDIYILGLKLDFDETDLWWLITYRARQLFYHQDSSIENRIYYFIPSEYKDGVKGKLNLLASYGVTVIDKLSGKHRINYYHKVLDFIAVGE